MTTVTRPDTLLPDPEPRAGALHGDLGRRPPGRAAGHVRGPAARPLRRPGPAGRREPTGPPALGVRRQPLLPGRDERGGRTPSRVRHPGADPLRGHAPRVLGHRRPHRRHGHQRGVGVAQLPLPDHRVLGTGLLRGPGPRAGPGRHPGLERLALRGVVAALSRPHHPRAASPSWPTPSSGRRRSGATPNAGSGRSPSPSGPTGSGCPASSRATGTRSSPPARRPTRSSRSTSGPRACPTCPTDSPMVALGATLFGQMSLSACAEWIWSGLPVRYPGDQDRHERGGHRLGGHAARPARQHRRALGLRAGLRPVGAAARPRCWPRNFWFCTIDDPSTIETRHRIGIDHIMVEVDYPHGDSTWPDTQDGHRTVLGPPARSRTSAR